MNKHTPGKWKVGSKIARFVYASDETPICECDSMGEADALTERANARLISACPELLEALKYMVKWAERHGLTTGDLITGQQATLPVIDMARKAIAKAEGSK